MKSDKDGGCAVSPEPPLFASLVIGVEFDEIMYLNISVCAGIFRL
jgi:hypothetical protein